MSEYRTHHALPIRILMRGRNGPVYVASDVQDLLPTYRAHNEQAMAHAAIAYAKQMRRRRAMICTSSPQCSVR